ncbi:helix-turn-helix domain-containing protein [Actinocorallia sp. B10E7]|uniref:helix-turn-helix transcriptional regulator n=1 Tax=Actinocorallia sp. B10E7 TaxID=3153558 RepID=UPI00325C8C0F
MAAEDIDPRAHQVLADVSRVAVLETLRRAGHPLTVPELAEAVGLHPNTVRAHLTLLTEHGHVTAEPEQRERPGRPRVLYSAPAPADDGRRDYRLLAETLIGYLSTQDGDRRQAAIEAGRGYGRRAVRHTESVGAIEDVRTDADTAIHKIVELLAEAGFAPRATADGTRIELHHCPFRELAETDADVVCGVHLGIMRGALAELGAPVEAVRLLPFVQPDLCVAELRR